MIKKLNFITATLLASSLLFTSCGFSDNNEPSNDNQDSQSNLSEIPFSYALSLITPKAYSDPSSIPLPKGSIISLIVPTSSTPYWDSLKQGAIDAIDALNQELKYTGKDKIILSLNSAGSVDEQINILDSELSRYPSVIAISAIDETAFGMQFDQALENGIPIVVSDSTSTSNIVSASIYDHNDAITQSLLNRIFENNSTDSDIFGFLIFASDLSSSKNISRLNSIQEYVSTSSDTDLETVIINLDDLEHYKRELYLQNDSNFTNKDASDDDEDFINEDISVDNDLYFKDIELDYSDSEVIDYVLNKYSHLTSAISLSNTSCISLINELDKLDFDYTDFTIYSYDSDSEIIEHLENNKVNSIVITNPYGTGYATIIAAARAAIDLGNEAYIHPGHTLVDLSNYSNYDIQEIIY